MCVTSNFGPHKSVEQLHFTIMSQVTSFIKDKVVCILESHKFHTHPHHTHTPAWSYITLSFYHLNLNEISMCAHMFRYAIQNYKIAQFTHVGLGHLWTCASGLLVPNMALLTSVMGRSYRTGTLVWDDSVGGGME